MNLARPKSSRELPTAAPSNVFSVSEIAITAAAESLCGPTPLFWGEKVLLTLTINLIKDN